MIINNDEYKSALDELQLLEELAVYEAKAETGESVS